MSKHLSMVFGDSPNTPQTEQAKPDQVVNNAGGFVFATGIWMQLSRFLILGTEGGTFYVSEKSFTKDNAQNTLACIKENGIKAVDEIVRVSVEGRAAKNDYAIFALAMAGSFGDLETKRYALGKLNEVCRTGTHLFQFVDYISGMRGWGRLLTNAVANWYLSKNAGQVAYQAVKYQSRAIEGKQPWSHDDVLRKCHAKAPEGSEMQQVFRWITEGWVVTKAGKATVQHLVSPAGNQKGKVPSDRATYEINIPNSLRILEGYELAKSETDPKKVANLITDYGLTHEMIPTSVKTSPVVWEALLEKMPMTAMIRNLGNMSKAGILGPNSKGEIKVRSALVSHENLAKARVHPMQIMSALKVYETGRGFKGSNTWTVNPSISSALEDSFYLSFDYVEASNKRFFIGQDVSGSMSWEKMGSTGLTPAQASAIIGMVTMKTEPYCFHGGFSDVLVPTGITKNMRMKEVETTIGRISMGSTDCALPMIYAAKNSIPVDVFAIYTDNETYAGRSHPFQALKNYRQKMGINAKLVVVGMTSTGFSIADPSDAGSLDVVGFDTSTPSVITNFAK